MALAPRVTAAEESALKRISEDLAPALAATRGGIITEFIATRGMGISLYRDRYKLSFHMNFKMLEFFDLGKDSKEMHNLVGAAPPAMAPMLDDLQRFLTLRGCKYRYSLPEGVSGPTLYVRNR